MYLRTKALAGVVAMLAVTGLAACGSTGSSTGSSKGALTFWIPEPDPQPNTFQNAAKRFTKQTGIKVKVDAYPWSSYQTKLTTALTSSTGPDVAEIGNTWADALAKTKGLTTWTDADFTAIGGKDQFVPSALTVTGTPGQPPASVPVSSQTWALLYNKAMFKTAGIAKPPATWDELVTDAKKLTNKSKGVYGVATTAAGAPTAAQTFGWVMASQYGGSLVTSSGKSTMNTPPTVNAVTNWVKWVAQDGILSPDVATDSTGTKSDADFINGKAAMDITQDVQPAIKNPKTTGLALIPLQTANAAGSKGIMSHVAGENLAIFKNSGKKSQAQKLVKFLASDSEQIELNKELYQIPSTVSASKNAYFQTPNMKIFNSILQKHAEPVPTGKGAYGVINAYGTAIVNLFRQGANTHSITKGQVSSALSKADATADATGGQ